LKYIAGFPDVWFARHEELAQWALASDVDEHTYQSRFFGGDASGARPARGAPARPASVR
jgi:hypothetical protein